MRQALALNKEDMKNRGTAIRKISQIVIMPLESVFNCMWVVGATMFPVSDKDVFREVMRAATGGVESAALRL